MRDKGLSEHGHNAIRVANLLQFACNMEVTKMLGQNMAGSLNTLTEAVNKVKIGTTSNFSAKATPSIPGVQPLFHK